MIKTTCLTSKACLHRIPSLNHEFLVAETSKITFQKNSKAWWKTTILLNLTATHIVHSVRQILEILRTAYQTTVNLIAAYRNLIENDCLYWSFPFHVESHFLSLAKTTLFWIISHIVKLVISWNSKLSVFYYG